MSYELSEKDGENKYDSIFDDINDLEFEEMLKECGFEYEKVEPGKGGLYFGY